MQLLEEYLDSILEQVHPLSPIELPIEEALDHVLACDLEARVAVPPFSNSGMDGFAIYLDEDYEASPETPLTLPVAGDIAAGDNTDHVLEPGSAWRIMTGARVPKGANTVVPVEDTSEEPGPHPLPKSISIYAPIKVGAHVRVQGEDCSPGDTVLRAGDVLTPAAMASAVSVGYAKVNVYPSPRVAIVSTGDELRAPGEDLKGAQIPDSNSVMIAALARRAGAQVAGVFRSNDDPAQFADVLQRAGEVADLIITSGGVSAGAYDVVKEVGLGQGVEFVRVAMQPGKPQGFGVLQAADGREVLLATLPGNPVSVFVSFHMFVRPILAELTGRDGHELLRPIVVTSPNGWRSPAGKRQLVPVVLSEPDGPEQTPVVVPTHKLGSRSHLVASLHSVNALAIVPEDVTSVEPWSILTAIRV